MLSPEKSALESQVSSLAIAVERLQHSVDDVTSSLAGQTKSDGGGHAAVDQSLDLAEELRQLKLLLAQGNAVGNDPSGAATSSRMDPSTGNGVSMATSDDTRTLAGEELGSNILVQRSRQNAFGIPGAGGDDDTPVKQATEGQVSAAPANHRMGSHAKGFGLSPGFSEYASAELIHEATAASGSASSSSRNQRHTDGATPLGLRDTFGTRIAADEEINRSGNGAEVPGPPQRQLTTPSFASGRSSTAADEQYQRFLGTVEQPGVTWDEKGKGKQPMVDPEPEAPAAPVPQGGGSEPRDPPHPQSYLDVMAALQAGRPIPGIKNIDDSPPHPEKPIPESTRRAPAKPWENSNGTLGSDGGFDDRIPFWMANAGAE